MGYVLMLLIYIVAPIVISIILICKCVKSLKGLKLTLVALVALLLIVIGSNISGSNRRENADRNIYAKIPQAIEIFQQSREQLDVLANGDFSVNSGRVYRHQEYGWVLFANWRSFYTPFEDWDTIEWLSDEEREALIYLLSGEELEYNFRSISAIGAEPSIQAPLFRQEDAALSISYGRSVFGGGHPIDLGEGYTLWFFSSRGDGGVGTMRIVIISFVIVATAIQLGVVWSKEKQKAEPDQSTEE